MNVPATLGEVIKQANQARRFTLCCLADYVMKNDAMPLNPRYLVDIEVHHCGPAPRVLREPARVLELDYDALLPVTGGLMWSCGNTFSLILRMKR
jgi:hypothetical protein